MHFMPGDGKWQVGVIGSGLDLVKTSLGRVIQREQLDVVVLAEGEAAGKITYHFLAGLLWPLSFGQNPRRCFGFLACSRVRNPRRCLGYRRAKNV